MGACCAKDVRNNKIDSQEHNLRLNNDSTNQGQDKAVDEQTSKPLPLQKPQEPDYEVQFIEKALTFQSPNSEVNVLS